MTQLLCWKENIELLNTIFDGYECEVVIGEPDNEGDILCEFKTTGEWDSQKWNHYQNNRLRK